MVYWILMNSNFEASPAHQSTGNEYSWDGKGPGFESDQDLFFFQKRNIPFQKNCGLLCKLMFCQLSCHISELSAYYVCFVGIVATSICFLLLLQFVIHRSLTSYIFFFFSLNNFFGLNDFGLYFIGLLIQLRGVRGKHYLYAFL